MPDNKQQWNLGDYVTVDERMAAFFERYPDGSLQTEWPPLLLDTEGGQYLAIRGFAYRTPDDKRPGIGSAWEKVPGATPYTKTSELQNSETSAWGRALAALGIGTHAGPASRDEVEQARARQSSGQQRPPVASQGQSYAWEDELKAGMKKHGLSGGDIAAVINKSEKATRKEIDDWLADVGDDALNVLLTTAYDKKLEVEA